jgi:hypothetical protein
LKRGHISPSPPQVTTLEGCASDLEPLITSARTMRRNASTSADFGHDAGIDTRTLSGMLLGMRVAVVDMRRVCRYSTRAGRSHLRVSPRQAGSRGQTAHHNTV